ncbi:MAG: N-acetyltransferase [Caldilineae bacterium]|nr:MAG: N-acetyltransferase [Caldilineae bacterium]
MLQGKLVRLRPIERADLPNYVRWFADPEVLRYFGNYLPLSLAQEERWYERQLDSGSINFAVEYQGRHVGGAGFAHIDHRNQNAEVGLVIGEKDLWDRGLGQDTLATLVDYGFAYLNLHRIYLRVFAENKRAIHAYEKVGFREEDRFREAEWRHGRWHDLCFMSILRREWEHRQQEG